MNEGDDVDEEMSECSSAWDYDFNEQPIRLADDQWVWKREQLQGSTVRMNQDCQIHIVDEIREQLESYGKRCYSTFVNSCFGKLLQIRTANYSILSCIHELFTYEVTISAAPADERWFKIGDLFLRFSKYEFALVMGLRFGDQHYDRTMSYKSVLSRDGLYTRYFKEYENGITPSLLRDKFNSHQFPADDAVRVAKLLLLHYILIGHDNRKLKINPWVWDMIDDTERWESFPWGSYSYELLLMRMDKIPVNIDNEKLSGLNYRYHLYGCSVAVVVWCYEAIPNIGHMFAKKIKNEHRQRPRVIRWEFKKVTKRRHTMASELFKCENYQLPCHVHLRPTYLETQELYWMDLHCRGFIHPYPPPIIEPEVHHAPPIIKSKVHHSPPIIEPETDKLPGHVGFNQWERSQPSTVDPHGVYLTRSEYEKLQKKSNEAIMSELHAIEDRLMDGIISSQQTCAYNLLMSHGYNVSFHKSISDSLSSFFHQFNSSSHANSTFPSPNVLHNAQQATPTPTPTHFMPDLNPNVIPTGVLYPVPNMCPPEPMAYPINTTFLDLETIRANLATSREKLVLSPYTVPDDHWAKRFMDFLKSNKLLWIVYREIYVDKIWFLELMNIKEELDTQHIDCYLRILQEDPSFLKVFPLEYQGEVAIMDTQFAQSIDLAWTKHHENDEYGSSYDKNVLETYTREELASLIPYVHGQHQHWKNTKAWKDVDWVMMIICKNRHFMACRIELSTGLFTIHDSFRHKWDKSMKDDRCFNTYSYRRIIPLLLQYGGVYDQRPNTSRKAELTCPRPNLNVTYLQTDDKSCGVFAMLTIQALIHGRWFPSKVVNDCIQEFRNEIAYLIFRYFSETVVQQRLA